eukprot:COSAG01_NODE_71967_length_254_cov_0.767742_1_plen_44_part_01
MQAGTAAQLFAAYFLFHDIYRHKDVLLSVSGDFGTPARCAGGAL